MPSVGSLNNWRQATSLPLLRVGLMQPVLSSGEGKLSMATDQTHRYRSLTRRGFRGFFWLMLFGYGILCAHFYLDQESYLLEPNAAPTGEKPSSIESEEFDMSVEPDGKIHYRRYRPTENEQRGSVLYLHGNRGNMDRCEWEIEFLLNHGYEVWTMDYRGFGDSVGSPSESALINDANAVFSQMMLSQPQAPIVVWGRSFGSGIASAVVAGSKRKPDLLVLETPYWSIVDAARAKHWYLPPIIFCYELPTHRFLKSAGCSVHLIHGTRDEKIASDSSDRLYDLCQRSGIHVTGHSVMCGNHTLRDRAEFAKIARSILIPEH